MVVLEFALHMRDACKYELVRVHTEPCAGVLSYEKVSHYGRRKGCKKKREEGIPYLLEPA